MMVNQPSFGKTKGPVQGLCILYQWSSRQGQRRIEDELSARGKQKLELEAVIFCTPNQIHANHSSRPSTCAVDDYFAWGFNLDQK